MEFRTKPFSSAAAQTIGLNAEPGCLFACVTLLNSLDLKLKPPTKALTSPVYGSKTIIPPFTLNCLIFQELFGFSLQKLNLLFVNIWNHYFSE